MARPEDELARMMRLQPRVRPAPNAQVGPGAIEYDFRSSPSVVLASIPGVVNNRWRHGASFSSYIDLPSGRLGQIDYFAPGVGGYTCVVFIGPSRTPQRPWYRKAWLAVRSRLGL